MTSSIAEKALEQLKMSLSRVKSGKAVTIHEKVGFEWYDGSYRETSTRSIDWWVQNWCPDWLPEPKNNPKYRFWRVPAHTLKIGRPTRTTGTPKKPLAALCPPEPVSLEKQGETLSRPRVDIFASSWDDWLCCLSKTNSPSCVFHYFFQVFRPAAFGRWPENLKQIAKNALRAANINKFNDNFIAAHCGGIFSCTKPSGGRSGVAEWGLELHL